MLFKRTRRRRVTQPLGIWQPEYRRDYSAYAAEPGAALADATAEARERRPRRWGLLSVLLSFVVFLVVQALYGLYLFHQYALLHDAQLNRLAELTFSNPASRAARDAYNKLIADLLAYSGQPEHLLVGSALMYGTWLAFMAFATFVRGRRSFRKDFWLGFRWIDIPLGFLIAVGAVLAFKLIYTIAAWLQIDLSGTNNGAALFQSSGIWLFLIPFGLGGILGPIMEELYFRGFVMQGLIRHFRHGLGTRPTTWGGMRVQRTAPGLYRAHLAVRHWLYHHKYALAVLITAVIFGLVHTPAVQGGGNMLFVGLATGSLGAVLGFIAIRTRRLGMNMMVHISYNTLGVALAFLVPTW